MTQIFFFSDKGSQPLDDEVFRSLVVDFHYWQADDGVVYGVCSPARHANPLLVVERLENLGVDVLPAQRDPDSPDPKDKVMKGLEKHGIAKGDKAKDIVKKMADKSGNPALRPHYF